MRHASQVVSHLECTLVQFGEQTNPTQAFGSCHEAIQSTINPVIKQTKNKNSFIVNRYKNLLSETNEIVKIK